MTATAHVVRVQNVQAENFVFFFGNGAVGLCRKELLACFGREQLLLRKGDAFFDDFVPDADHCRKVHFVVLGVPAHICAVGLYSGGNRRRLCLPLTSQNQASLLESCPQGVTYRNTWEFTPLVFLSPLGNP